MYEAKGNNRGVIIANFENRISEIHANLAIDISCSLLAGIQLRVGNRTKRSHEHG